MGREIKMIFSRRHPPETSSLIDTTAKATAISVIDEGDIEKRSDAIHKNGVDVEKTQVPAASAVELTGSTSSASSERFDHEAADNNDSSNDHQEEDFNREGVRAAVRTVDTGEPANTLRVWILGMLLVTASSGANMFLSMRSPAASIPTVALVLFVHPLGRLWARWMPEGRFTVFGRRFSINPGPWNVKEHAVVTLMANVTYGYAYATDALLALEAKPLYARDFGWAFAILFTISSQLVGVAFAGLARRFLVWPEAMAWPSTFSITALLYALHDTSKKLDPAKANGWRISPVRYFGYLAAAAFAYYWIPGVLFQGLSVFAIVTFAAPNNATLNQLFGGYTGLSLLPITFDWTYVIAYLGDPLLAPTRAHVNTLLGVSIFVVLTAIGISFTNTWDSAYLPMNTSTGYDNTQNEYNVSHILGPNFTFDVDKYRDYSPLFLAPTFALNYGLSFAAFAAAIVHIGLHHGKALWRQARAPRQSFDAGGAHLRLMQRYADAPAWWYVALLLAAVGVAFAATLAWDTQLPWWGLILALAIALVFLIPSCVVYGTTNVPLSLNVVAPYIAGYALPGRPFAVMAFKVYSTIALGQAQTFAADLKLAHYIAVPPRVSFAAQAVATVWACVVQVAVLRWTLGHVEGACEAEQPQHFTCPNGEYPVFYVVNVKTDLQILGRTFFTNSITWGLIGPQRLFGAGARYSALSGFWALGAGLPLLLWVLTRSFSRLSMRSPRKLYSWILTGLSTLHAPILLGSAQWLPPASPLSFFSWGFVGLLFNWYIRRRFNGWWKNYNYVTAAALDAGVLLSGLLVFLVIELPGVQAPMWWGNDGALSTSDALATAVRRVLGQGETFGPASW